MSDQDKQEKDQKPTFSAEQQAFIDKLVGNARIKAREGAKKEHETALARAKEADAEAALVAEKKWRELAEKYEARVKGLEPLEAQAKAYEELIEGMLKDRIKELGDAAKKVVGGLPESMVAVEKLKWLNDNADLFSEPGDGVGTPGRTKKRAKQEIQPDKISKFPIRL